MITTQMVNFNLEKDNIKYNVRLVQSKENFYLEFNLKVDRKDHFLCYYTVSEYEGDYLLKSFYEDERNFHRFISLYVFPLCLS